MSSATRRLRLRMQVTRHRGYEVVNEPRFATGLDLHAGVARPVYDRLRQFGTDEPARRTWRS